MNITRHMKSEANKMLNYIFTVKHALNSKYILFALFLFIFLFVFASENILWYSNHSFSRAKIQKNLKSMLQSKNYMKCTTYLFPLTKVANRLWS